MKNALMIFALLFTVSSIAFAQSEKDKPTDEKAFLEQQVDHYTQALNVTKQQDKQIDQIVDNRYNEYAKAKVNVTDPMDLRKLRKSYIKLVLNDIKPVLTAEQWQEVQIELDKRKNFSLN